MYTHIYIPQLHQLVTVEFFPDSTLDQRIKKPSCGKSFCQGDPFGLTPSAAKAHGSDRCGKTLVP